MDEGIAEGEDGGRGDGWGGGRRVSVRESM